jgi:hypothetical protein
LRQTAAYDVKGDVRQGGPCASVSYFFDSLAEFQTAGCLLKGKVGGAFTSVGGQGRGYGGHEVGIFAAFPSTSNGCRQFLRNRRSKRHIVPLHGKSDRLFSEGLKFETR